MKHLYNTEHALQTDTRVRLEVNYNRTIFGMTKPGDILYYKAPNDPSEHPMYVDAEGRNIPVSSDTLQPMTNATGNIVDSNGVLFPPYLDGNSPHIDDIRVAVTSADFEILDEKGDPLMIAHDGHIIPTDDHGQPMTTLVNGEPWVVDENGDPYAPLSRVYPLSSYVNPVRAENPGVDDIYEDYFDIDSLVSANRPSRRGIQVAWSTSRDNATPIRSGMHGYKGARFYTAHKDRQYKYWTSPTVSDAAPVLVGSTLSTFGTGWVVAGGNGVATADNMISADFPSRHLTADQYFETVLHLDSDQSYEASFEILAQSAALVSYELLEWSDEQTDSSQIFSGSFMPRQHIGGRSVPGGIATPVTLDINPTPGSVTQVLRIIVRRTNFVTQQKVTLNNLSLRASGYPLEDAAPRAVYDRPIRVNKIVVGVEYSADESLVKGISHGNKPSQHQVLVYVDRGDGVFEWQPAAVNPSISESGHITLYWNGTEWTDEETYGFETTVMGIQYEVTAMRRKGVRLNVMEISARHIFDVTEFYMGYDHSSEATDNSFVLPFGTVNSNTGSVELSNHDGRFNPENEFLLDMERDPGATAFTTIKNPFYQILNESVNITIDTATFVPDSTDEKDYVRVVTARTDGDFRGERDMVANIPFSDNAKLLDSIIPNQRYYSGNNMSLFQVLYMLLDSVGFTDVKFSDEDEHFSTHMDHFWVREDSDSLWSIIADICKAHQTVAYFDANNVLNFRSLKGMYEHALTGAPAQIYTTDDLDGTLANIREMTLDGVVSVNKVNLNYREIKTAELTPSGSTPMDIVWQPEGTELLRSALIVNNLNDKQVGKGGNWYFQLQPGVPKTWPFEGMVQIEGELIKYSGKHYKYHLPDGTTATKYIRSDDERKELDKKNEYLAMNNVYTGIMKIVERGAEGTLIREHVKPRLADFTTKRSLSGTTTQNNYTKGLSIKNSRLFVIGQKGSNQHTVTTITDGKTYDTRPQYVGTRLRINEGSTAGVCFVSGTHEDGLYVELMTTEQTEANGRSRGELHVFSRKNGVNTFHGVGANVPISKFKDYDLDVFLGFAKKTQITRSYLEYYDLPLQFGDRGAYVRVLQAALNEHLERLAVDGIFGTKTKAAVVRLQRRRGLTQDGIVNIEEWKALETGSYDANVLVVNAQVDGNHVETVRIPFSILPSTINDGRYGVFTRTTTSASFEYFYGVRGSEDVEFDESNFFDYVKGGYVSDQLDAGWIYRTKKKTVKIGGKSRQVDYVTNQLKINEFGPWAHEVRDYEVKFEETEVPAVSSYLYYSNTPGAHVINYTHGPFSAKFRLANKQRNDVVLNGEDTITFGSEDPVEQRMMIYGNTLKVNDERVVSVTNKTSTAARGIEELSIDVDWLQTKEAAEKLGSHIVEAMSNPVPTYDLDVFGNASVRVGQVVSIYNPRLGVGDINNVEASNRFFVYSVDQSNDGTQSTSLKARQVIGDGGVRNITLRDVYERNNNAANYNWDMSEVENRRAKGYTYRNGITAVYAASPDPSKGGSMLIRGTGASSYASSMLLSPYPDSVGRLPHNYGDYYLAYIKVTAKHDTAAGIFIEGWPTTGTMTKVLASNAVKLKDGESKTIVLKGRFLSDPDIPEIHVGMRILDKDNATDGGRPWRGVYLDEFYFRSSQNEADIYPLHGGMEFKSL